MLRTPRAIGTKESGVGPTVFLAVEGSAACLGAGRPSASASTRRGRACCRGLDFAVWPQGQYSRLQFRETVATDLRIARESSGRGVPAAQVGRPAAQRREDNGVRGGLQISPQASRPDRRRPADHGDLLMSDRPKRGGRPKLSDSPSPSGRSASGKPAAPRQKAAARGGKLSASAGKPIRAVLFDFYQTIVDIKTDETQLRLWKILAAFLGYRGACVTAAELRDLYRQTLQAGLAMSPLAHPELDVADVFGEVLKSAARRPGPSFPHFLRNCSGRSRSATWASFPSPGKSRYARPALPPGTDLGSSETLYRARVARHRWKDCSR